MGKPLDFSAFLQPIPLTSCISKLFERINLSRLLFFLEFIPFRLLARSVSDTVRQLSIRFFVFQFIFDELNNSSRALRPSLPLLTFLRFVTLSGISLSLPKLLLAGLPPWFDLWTQSFFSNRRASVVLHNHTSRSFRVRRGVPLGSGLDPVLFSLFINNLLPSAALFLADDVVISSSSP